MDGVDEYDTMNDDAQPPSPAVDAADRQPPHDPIPDNSNVPKPKRLACMICRKRKLKCDGVRPSCSTCSRLGHSCTYDEQRRKSGPKRGYVKALEERLKQVETLLKTQDPPSSNNAQSNTIPTPMHGVHSTQTTAPPSIPVPNPNAAMGVGPDREWHFGGDSPQAGAMDDFNFNANMGVPVSGVTGSITWEMIGLGLEEPLPPQETIDELHQIYFEKVHPSIAMIHKYRYLAAMNLAPSKRPPVCLRYAMWTLACSIADKYSDLKDLFYQRARKYIEADYIKGYGEHMISVAHCQAHALLACYEMRMMYFPRAWINTGSAVRLAQMIGLHRLDGQGLEVKQCIPPPKDWTEREERRRTFWIAFCTDRYASIGTGWPMTVDERDIMTNLPASEEAFEMSRPELTQSLQECTKSPDGVSKLTPFGGIVLMASLFGRNLIHLHRSDDDDDLEHDLNGPFWKRHRAMDNILLNTSLSLPAHLKLPAGLCNTNVVFINMSIHTSTICLHQAAIFKAEKNKLAASVSSESKVRCITAANEIASIMRTVSHMDLASMNPFISFCLYVAARVFVQYLKSRPDDSQSADSLRFLISAMRALKRRNPLTESFLVQLDVDFEALAVRIPKLRNAFPRSSDSPAFSSQRGPMAKKQTFRSDEGMHGILGYRGQSFAKPSGDEVNQSAAPELGDRPSEPQGHFGQAMWLTGDQQLPVLTPSTGTMYDKTAPAGAQMTGFGDQNGEGQEASGSPEGCQSSSGPTPVSSHATSSEARCHLMPGRMQGSGAESFQASPVTPTQNLMGGGGVDVGGQGFLGDANGFSMPGLEDQQGFSANAWGDLQTQAAMPPVGDGVLRALMNMRPMDAMDISTWDTGAENMQ
ncbi:fungal-specific transcription factor domain-containing protein [Stachybotrys elegans]|uniref:Fungal-specific transcription factor domain-containing protein n=1 Tax=Stachybotrys elegans TaxID=80388 RepID=A0A8K0WVY0_9HYPO|nr:fungal-specific transcription factor domain-containing protein [Stachybotrys elegans]